MKWIEWFHYIYSCSSASGMRQQSFHAFIRLLAERFAANRCPQVAGSLTFTTLLSLVPLLTVIIGLFGSLPALNVIGSVLADFLQANLLPDKTGPIVTTYILQFSEQASRLTLIGTVIIAVTALMLLSSIERTLNQIWGVQRPRPLLQRITVYWFTLTFGPIILGCSIFATGYLISSSNLWTTNLPWVSDLAATLLPPLLLGALFTFLYYAVPNYPVHLRYAAGAGIITALAFMLMQRIFGEFIAHVPTYTLIYGTFAALPIFLIWLYLSWGVVLLGALLSACLPALFTPQPQLLHFAGSRAWVVTTLLIQLAIAQQKGEKLTLETLSTHVKNLPEHIIQHLLEDLSHIGWVSATTDNHWILAISAEQLDTHHIIERFALDTRRWHALSNNGPLAVYADQLADSLSRTSQTLIQLRDETLSLQQRQKEKSDI